MRRGWILGVGAGLLLLLLWLVWRSGAAPESISRAKAPSRGPQVERTQAASSLWSSAAPAEPRGTLSIQGQVVGSWGPVPGAVVVALAPVPRGLSTLPSPWRSWRDDGRILSPCELSRDALPLDLAAEFRKWQVPLARTTTDAQGQFRLEGLEGGAVALWAESGEGIGLKAEVAAGSVDVEVPLGPGRTFSGEVYDEQGRPVAGASVTTLLRGVGHFVEASTNAEGRFLLGPLPWGGYDLLVSKEGLVSVRMESWWDQVTLPAPLRLSGQVVDARGAVPGVTVQVEGSTRVAPAVTDVKGQFRLEGLCPGAYVLTASLAERYARREVALAPRGDRESVVLLLGNRLRVSGRVVDTSGQPIPNASVIAFSEAPQWRDEVRTDARGGFLFDRLVPGTYKLALISARHEALEVPPHRFVESRELPPFTLKEREVRPRAAAGDSTLEVEWVDAVGRPVPQASVHLSRKNSRSGDTVTTGMDGLAVFQGLLPGSYVVRPRAREQWLRYAPVEVELRSTETRRIRLQSEEGLSLSGQIVDDGGKPLEGVILKASWRAGDGALPADASSERLRRSPVEGVSGPEGAFTLAHLPEGSCTLQASLRGYTLDTSASSGLDGRTTIYGDAVAVVSPGGPDVRIVLRAEARVVGRVVREDGAPIPSFRINNEMVNHPEGRFSVPLRRDGPWRFEAPGFSRVQRVVSRQGDEERDLGDVVLVEDRTVRGRVLEAGTSVPIAGAWVEVVSREHSPGAGVESATYTLPDGSFTVEGVKAGMKTVRVSHPDWPPAQVVLAEKQREVTVEIEPGATLEGRVEVAGAPVRSGFVRLRSEQGEVITRGFGEGRYSLRAIPADRYLVQVEGQSEDGVVSRFPMRQVTLSRGDKVMLDFIERSEGTILEVLVPERNLQVHLIPGNLPLMGPRDGLFLKLGSGLMGKTVREGVQSFPRLPAGNYTLFAMRRGEDSTEVHREELELPAEGDVSFTLLPVWTHYAD